MTEECPFDDTLWNLLDDLREGTEVERTADAKGGNGIAAGLELGAAAAAGTAAIVGDSVAEKPKTRPNRCRGGIGYGARKRLDDDELVCENCNGKHMQVEEGQYVCCECNFIQSRVIDNGAEWRFYGVEDSRDDDPTRCGMPTNNLLPKSSLGSMVGGRWNSNPDHRRLRQFQMWNSMPYWERTLYYVFEKLSSSAASHGISSKILDDAKILYKTVSEKKISRGDNKDGLVASCLYNACAINKCPRSTKEIARMFGIKPVVLTKGNARFQELMQIPVESSGPEDFIGRFGSRLNMDFADVQRCRELTKRMDELEIVSENAPTSVAAGALYYYVMTHGLDYSKKQIAEVCEVSEVTITKCYKRILKFKDLLG